MRDITRIPVVMEKLQEVWKNVPDMRFGQLLYCIMHGLPSNGEITFESRLFNMEEDKFLQLIEVYKNQHFQHTTKEMQNGT